jgi:hypothetical protein
LVPVTSNIRFVPESFQECLESHLVEWDVIANEHFWAGTCHRYLFFTAFKRLEVDSRPLNFCIRALLELSIEHLIDVGVRKLLHLDMKGYSCANVFLALYLEGVVDIMRKFLGDSVGYLKTKPHILLLILIDDFKQVDRVRGAAQYLLNSV